MTTMQRQKKSSGSSIDRSKPTHVAPVPASSSSSSSSSRKRRSSKESSRKAKNGGSVDDDDNENNSKRRQQGPPGRVSSGSSTTSSRHQRHHHHLHHANTAAAAAATSSDDDDIDPELREGINNIMKLRDEYDKLEGALRKLGVDPERVVHPHDEGDDEGDVDEEDDDDEDEEDSLRRRQQQLDRELMAELDPLQPRTMDRHHLGILEEVDESLLSASSDVELCGVGGGQALQPLQQAQPPSYPWVQMALPGGGIVSVPLERDCSPDSSAAAAASAGPSSSLTVSAGEPVTHFNLDQLLEIVQSFQLDTTLAAHEDGEAAKQLNMVLAAANAADASQTESRALEGCDVVTRCDSVRSPTTSAKSEQQQRQQEQQQPARETHSCPSSPTETDCSSGFSTLRKRSVTLTEKIRTSRDGSKTQVVRQYGCNTSSAKEPSQNVSFQQNSFVYINGNNSKESGGVSDGNGSQSFPSLLPIASPTGSMHQQQQLPPHASDLLSGTHATLPRSAGSAATTGAGESVSAATGSLRAGMMDLGKCSSASSSYRGHIVRLNSIEPNTVMFSTRDYPILSDITVPEIIDELEKQFEAKLCDLQGVRLVANNVYVCLSRKDSLLQHLTTYGFYVRGVPVKVVDITNDSVVICLTGVPHYITDATVTMLVSTFGISIGEVERRFYKGVDTGERFVRLKPRAHTQVPDFVTVGGCKILIRVLSQEEVCQPFTLQSVSTTDETATAAATSSVLGGREEVEEEARSTSVTGLFSSSLVTTTATSSFIPSITPTLSSFGSSSNNNNNNSNSNSNGPKTRAKPGHCNGTVNSPPASAASKDILSSTCTDMLPLTSCITTTRTEMLSTGVTGLLSASNPSAASSELTSPKIAKSFRSRLTGVVMTGKPEGDDDLEAEDEVDNDGRDEPNSNTYVPAESLDLPALSPPPYKAPSSSAGSSSGGGSGTGGGVSGSISGTAVNGNKSSSSKTASSSRGGSGLLSSSLRRYKQHSSKTDSSSSLAGKSTEAVRDGGNNNISKRSSAVVAFEESRSGKSKTVNGILRKGSAPGQDIVASSATSGTNAASTEEKPRKSRKEKHHHKSSKEDKDKDKDKGGGGRGGGGGGGGGRSGNSSTKNGGSGSSNNKQAEKQKDLALTRDLPWCGCWGNGCL